MSGVGRSKDAVMGIVVLAENSNLFLQHRWLQKGASVQSPAGRGWCPCHSQLAVISAWASFVLF